MVDIPLIRSCPVCTALLPIPVGGRAAASLKIDCTNCGAHRIFGESILQMLEHAPEPLEGARMAFGKARIPLDHMLTLDELKLLAEKSTLPDPLERIDRLIEYMATRPVPSDPVTLTTRDMQAKVGAESQRTTEWVLLEARRSGLIIAPHNASRSDLYGLYFGDATLTVDGWKRWGELLRSGARSRHAFMAMKFSREMRAIVDDYMAPAVARAGFQLRTTADDHKSAGSIDNRMRVEIRTSRFMVCDLSDGNQGAYWEAGFAEGIGRPVIYTCRKDVLEAKGGVHFDTRQQLIIPWDPADMAPAMRDLTNVIRATLPAEAKLSDD